MTMAAPGSVSGPVGRLGVWRASAVALALLTGVWAAVDADMPFWVAGVHVAAVLGVVAAMTAVPVVVVGAVALALRRRGRAAALRIALVFGQAGWAAFVAGLAFSLSDLAIDQPAGWGLAVLTYGVGLAVVAAAWWSEDALSRRGRRA